MWQSFQRHYLGSGEHLHSAGCPGSSANTQCSSDLLPIAAGLAVTGTGGRQLHYPAGSAPGFTDVRWCLFCPQHPGDAAAVADLVIACHERDVTLSLKLAAYLAMQRLLVAFYRLQEVGSLLLEQLKNGRWVWSATPSEKASPTACISKSSSFSSPRSFMSTSRSWFPTMA